MGKKTRTKWGASDRTEEEFSLDVQDMLQLIAAGGMQWFEDMGIPENLIKNTLDQNYKLTQGYAPALKLRTVAMSHLYLGHIAEGILYMEKTIAEYSKYPNSRMGAVIVPDCQAWIDMAKNHPEEIPDKFTSIIAETRNNLHIQ